ncbi:hypothetical protein SAURM35S_03074 [Streptomyces aurantiogriseus]
MSTIKPVTNTGLWAGAGRALPLGSLAHLGKSRASARRSHGCGAARLQVLPS